jgi:hypothetical protein
MSAIYYPDTAKLIVRPTAPPLPFRQSQHNGRNRIWIGLTEYVSKHREGMPVAEFRKMAQRTSPYVQRQGDRDIDLYFRNLMKTGIPPSGGGGEVEWFFDPDGITALRAGGTARATS